MITTTIRLKAAYLAEYLRGKYNNCDEGPVSIPPTEDLYHVLWQFMAKRPKNASPIDEGNLTLLLPDRRVGKNPEVYNYLPERSVHCFEESVRRMFNVELHQLMEANESDPYGVTNLDCVYRFIATYGLESITEDALLKNYYRWRENFRKRARRNIMRRSDS